MTQSRELKPGDLVYIARKKTRTAKGLEMYIVQEDGERLWDICQRFGVRMSSVCKRNKLDPEAELCAEQTILLR